LKLALFGFGKAASPLFDRGQMFQDQHQPISLLCGDVVETVLAKPIARYVARANASIGASGFQRLGAADQQRAANRQPIRPRRALAKPLLRLTAFRDHVGAVGHPIPACSAARVTLASADDGAFRLSR